MCVCVCVCGGLLLFLLNILLCESLAVIWNVGVPPLSREIPCERYAPLEETAHVYGQVFSALICHAALWEGGQVNPALIIIPPAAFHESESGMHALRNICPGALWEGEQGSHLLRLSALLHSADLCSWRETDSTWCLFKCLLEESPESDSSKDEGYWGLFFVCAHALCWGDTEILNV